MRDASVSSFSGNLIALSACDPPADFKWPSRIRYIFSICVKRSEGQKSLAYRGVQYVHWVIHKCIMVKVGGKRNTQKACKKQVSFSKTGGEFLKVGVINNFRET